MHLVEGVFRDMAAGGAAAPPKERALPVMRSEDRRFCHELAAFYALRTESVDAEPARSVVVYRAERGPAPKIPRPLLSEAARVPAPTPTPAP